MPPIALQPDWFDMLGEIEKQMKDCFIAHRYKYPTEEKEVYVVPICKYKEAVESGLKFLEFAILYLTDIAQHIETVQPWSLSSGKPRFIVAYDNGISTLPPGKILGVDVSMGDPLFLWKECRVSPFNFPEDHCLLMEKKERA